MSISSNTGVYHSCPSWGSANGAAADAAKSSAAKGIQFVAMKVSAAPEPGVYRFCVPLPVSML